MVQKRERSARCSSEIPPWGTLRKYVENKGTEPWGRWCMCNLVKEHCTYCCIQWTSCPTTSKNLSKRMYRRKELCPLLTNHWKTRCGMQRSETFSFRSATNGCNVCFDISGQGRHWPWGEDAVPRAWFSGPFVSQRASSCKSHCWSIIRRCYAHCGERTMGAS